MVPSRVFFSVFSQCTCVRVGAVAADEDGMLWRWLRMLSSYVPSLCVGTVAMSEDGGVMEAVSFARGMLSSIIFTASFSVIDMGQDGMPHKWLCMLSIWCFFFCFFLLLSIVAVSQDGDVTEIAVCVVQ